MVRSSVTLNVQRCILRVVVVTSVLVLSPGANAADPFERINRVTHAINEGVDRRLLRPAPCALRPSAIHGYYRHLFGADWVTLVVGCVGFTAFACFTCLA